MKNILLTGGTGALGSALVPVLIEDPEVTLHLLVRAETTEELQWRAAQMAHYWARAYALTVDSRVHFYRGDVCQPRLGLSDNDYRQLTGSTTHVVHCAGNVKLNQSMEAARYSAVGGARQVLAFMDLCRRRGGFEKIDVVSTIGVAGRLQGLVAERRFTERRLFRNTYEAAKAEAEELYWTEIDNGAPLTIHRPSMVVGDSRTGGAIHAQVFFYLAEFLSGVNTYGFVPTVGEAKLDIVPADFVARAMADSLYCEDAIGRVFHLCGGPSQELPLIELIHETRTICAKNGVRLPKLKPLSPAVFGRLLSAAAMFARASRKRSLRSVGYFLAYLKDSQTFNVTETEKFFQSQGRSWPTTDQYLDKILSFYFCQNKPLATRSRVRRTA